MAQTNKCKLLEAFVEGDMLLNNIEGRAVLGNSLVSYVHLLKKDGFDIEVIKRNSRVTAYRLNTPIEEIDFQRGTLKGKPVRRTRCSCGMGLIVVKGMCQKCYQNQSRKKRLSDHNRAKVLAQEIKPMYKPKHLQHMSTAQILRVWKNIDIMIEKR